MKGFTSKYKKELEDVLYLDSEDIQALEDMMIKSVQ